MKKLESTWYNMAIVLTLISVIAGAALAYVNEITKGPIAEIQQQNEAQAIKTVLCDDNAVITDTIVNGEVTLYLTDNGAAVKTVDPKNESFSGGLTIMVGLDKEFKVLGYTVLVSNETPGLGAKIADEPSFAEAFVGQQVGSGDVLFEILKPANRQTELNGVDAISGATITSQALGNTLNQWFGFYQNYFVNNAECSFDCEACTEECAEVEPVNTVEE